MVRHSFQTEISSIKQHTTQLKSFKIKIPPKIEWKFLPGQYINLALVEDPTNFSGFSLTNSTEKKDELSISVKKIEEGGLTHGLFELGIGDPVIIKGPKGDFIVDYNNNPSAILVGGGIGVTPLISMFRTAAVHSTNPRVVLFHSAKTAKELLFYDELGKIAYYFSNLDYFAYVTRQPNWHGRVRRISVDDIFEHSQLKDFINCIFYICGPGAMNDQFKDGLVRKGVERKKILVESYHEP